MDKGNVREKLALVSDYWNPRIIAELNRQHVKVVKFKGEFVWHNHAEEDEFFLVLRGSFQMEFRDRIVSLNEGDFILVPRGVEHRPTADHEVEAMLFEPAHIKHTGDVETEITVHNYERI
jgi:mannose-6-phosphate isomerase-like protein (cupin superfamily)